MGLIKDAFKLVAEIVTLGGVGRLEEARKGYQRLYTEYEQLQGQCKRYESDVQNCLQAIGLGLTYARSRVQVADAILCSGRFELGEVELDRGPATLQMVRRFETSFSTAARVSSGAVVGSSAGLGAWALVSTFGAASTGTAIASLGGVAATNATLAWFGGGALAAGGAGMAGGTALLGGIVAVPLVYIAGRGMHKKAAKIEQEIPKLQCWIDNARSQLREASVYLLWIEERRRELTRDCYSFSSKIDALALVIQPSGVWSKLAQRLRRLFKRPAFPPEVLKSVEELEAVTLEFVSKFERREASSRGHSN